jgi:hypothetical protein
MVEMPGINMGGAGREHGESTAYYRTHVVQIWEVAFMAQTFKICGIYMGSMQHKYVK